ncbi:MAG: capsular biosynthesis protein [Bacteroidales bacterium]|nr:capsular biosynthesis protein [Bacteroidales bacterium]
MITDFHSHVLPGVDDGVRSEEESLAVLARLEREGVNTLWLTPHIMEDVPNETAALKARFARLKEIYTGPVSLHLAAEYMMDSLFIDRLAARDLLPIGELGTHLLVETSYFNPPANFEGLLDNIRSAGYFPVLAHPERYIYMEKADYKRLRASGVLFQLNLGSLSGAYGHTAKSKAKWLLRHKMYAVAGSDLHRERMVDMILQYRHPKRVLPLLESSLD